MAWCCRSAGPTSGATSSPASTWCAAPTRTVFGLTTPLITTASGAKMGKTAAGAVWLSGARLPPYDYWQFWRNTEDADVGRFLRLFTDLPLGEIDRLAALGGAEINEAKKVLATEATALCHGRAAADAAAETARATFEAGVTAETLPTHTVPAAELARRDPGVPPAGRKRPVRQPGRGPPSDTRRRRPGERHAGYRRSRDRDNGRLTGRCHQGVGGAQTASVGSGGLGA